MKIKKRKFGLKQFVDIANVIHNNFYDYSKFVYLGNNIKGIIICPIHGEFLQYPSTHIKGANCHKCVFTRLGNNCRLGTEKFIKKCNLIHNHKYDYSKVDYTTSMKKVEIICLHHGSFWMRPNDHLSGEQGCPQCFGKKKHTLSSFIYISKIKHNDIYDYSKVLYKGYRKHIIIICKKHGEFKQAPKNHMRGDGCPMCFESNGEKTIRKFLEQNNIKFETQKRFDGCITVLKNKIKLPFDFYLLDLKILIEYDGSQHYSPQQIKGISIEKAKINFERCQINDKIKTQYCKDNNIDLLRIPYTHFKKIDEILTDKIIKGINPLIDYPLIKNNELK